MLNRRSILGLNVIGHIANALKHQPVTAHSLSKVLDLSLSYTEGLMKELKAGDLIRAHRGPGGGYQLQQPISNMSVWDVASCFISDAEVKETQNDSSFEYSAAFTLQQKLDNIQRSFLQAYPLADVLNNLPPSPLDKDVVDGSKLNFHFKPIKKIALPFAPNSVFDLSNFLQLQVR